MRRDDLRFPVRWVGALVSIPGPSFLPAAGPQLGDAEEDVGTHRVFM